MKPIYPYIKANPRKDGLGYNPRCMIRDVSQYVSSHWTKDSDSYNLITHSTNITVFREQMQGDHDNGNLGVHGAGHYTSGGDPSGGDPSGDVFTSPGDPYFFLHRKSPSCKSQYQNLRV